MFYTIKPLFFIMVVMLSLLTSTCTAQRSAYTTNSVYLDSVNEDVKRYLCTGILKYPAGYETKKVKEDKLIVTVLNKLFQNNITIEEMESDFKRLKHARFSRKYKRNGLLEVNHLVISGNYLRIDVDIEHINSLIYRKYCSLSTFTRARCGESGIYVFDFNLIKKELLSTIKFPIGFMNDAIVVNYVITKNLEIASKNYPDYKFNLPKPVGHNLLNRIFANQYNTDSACCYNRLTANKDFVALIKAGEIKPIADLLYSPNYYYAVNAMESLIYLNSINQVSFDDSMKSRMELIKNSNYEMTIKQTNDVFPTVSGYKEIGTTDAAVIQKYSRALR